MSDPTETRHQIASSEHIFSNPLHAYLYASFIQTNDPHAINRRDFELLYTACSQLLTSKDYIQNEILTCLLQVPGLKVSTFYTHFYPGANQLRSSSKGESNIEYTITNCQRKINQALLYSSVAEHGYEDSESATIRDQFVSPVAWLVSHAASQKDWRGEYTGCMDISIRTTFQNFLERKKVTFNERILKVFVDGSEIEDTENYFDTEVHPPLREAWEFVKTKPPISALDNGTNIFIQSLKAKAHKNRFHPVEQFIRSLPSVEPGTIAEFCSIMGFSSDSFETLMVKKWLVSAIHRALNPGAQVDTMLVIHGKKGIGKSRAIRFLSSPTQENWYYQVGSGNPKEEALSCHRSWISNYDELAFLKSEKNRNELKEWLTKTTDTFRAPYECSPADFLRRFVFCGTTNDLEFLSSDPALQRRFFAVTATSMPSEEWLNANVVNLWADAKQLHDSGHQHWLTQDEEELHEKHMARYTGIDLQEDLALRIIKELAFTYRAIPQTELSSLLVKYDKSLENRIKRGQVIQRAMEQLDAPLNYKARTTLRGERIKVYVLPEVTGRNTFNFIEKKFDEDKNEYMDHANSLLWDCPILYHTKEFYRNEKDIPKLVRDF